MRFPGVGDRIRQRLRELGYWKGDRPDVARFCIERGYITQVVYSWLKNTVPSYDNLMKLSSDLAVSPGWLLLGEEAHKQPKRRRRPPSRRPG